MCRRCYSPPAVKATTARCDRCGNDATCWTLTRRLNPPEVPWPRWASKKWCFACIAHATITA